MDGFSLPSVWAQQLSHILIAQGTSRAPHSNLLASIAQKIYFLGDFTSREKEKKPPAKKLKFTLDSEKPSSVSDVLNPEYRGSLMKIQAVTCKEKWYFPKEPAQKMY